MYGIVDHRGKGEHTAHLAQRDTGLQGFLFCKYRVERAGLPDLLGIDRGALGIDSRKHFLMKECRNAMWRVVHQPVLNGGNAVTQYIGIQRSLAGILREMTNAVRNQLAALVGVKMSLRIEELIHIGTAQLCDALLLRHFLIESIHLLVYGQLMLATCHSK